MNAEERKKVNELRTAFEAEYGAEAVQTGSAAQPNPGAARASALCDYSIDEGLTPLDTTRHVALLQCPVLTSRSRGMDLVCIMMLTLPIFLRVWCDVVM